jgi:AcrR family transcriptional regulator
MSAVKPKRRYDSVRRREQARQTREAVLNTAQRLFLTNGFATTTIAAIAQQAEVSVDTIYKSFGGKAGLVRAISEHALAGDQTVPAETRSDALQASERDPRAIIRGWGKLTTEIAPRVVPILLLVRTAAGADPEMADLQSELNAQRLERMTRNAHNLAAANHLRENLSPKLAGEIMWTYSSPELYELLVLTRGWPLQRYGAFIADAMIAQLLPPETASPTATPRRRPQRLTHPPA